MTPGDFVLYLAILRLSVTPSGTQTDCIANKAERLCQTTALAELRDDEWADLELFRFAVSLFVRRLQRHRVGVPQELAAA